MSMKIPVAIPYLAKNSQKYIDQALKNKAISGLYGENLPAFEKAFADYVGVEHAISCSNGTVAIHLALAAKGIGPGDEILVASLTNMATFFAVLYCGAIPVPVDVDPLTYTISTDDLEAKISPNTKGIIVVHLFGQPCAMDQVMAIAERNLIPVFEDCAESHGATFQGKQTGSFGDAGCYSFFANKIINTGEGGIVTTNSNFLAEKMRSLKSLAFGKEDKFKHECIGYNYRMDNLKAALGRAQMEEVDDIISLKLQMGRRYDQYLLDEPKLILPISRPSIRNVYWMYHVRLVPELVSSRNEIMQGLQDEGIETRPGFVSYTLQPFCGAEIVSKYPCPVAEEVSYATFYLPSSHEIEDSIQQYVAEKLINILAKFK